MSVGNLKDQGGKGTNFPYQLGTLKLLDAVRQALVVAATPPNTYSATATFVPDVTGATDIFQISGTLNKEIRLRRVTFYATKTVAGSITVSLFSRGSLDLTLNTPLTAVKHSAANPNAMAIVKVTTANPGALGTSLGELRKDAYQVVATGNTPNILTYDFSNGQMPTITNDINPGFYLSLNGGILVGGSVTVVVEWDEVAI